MAAYPNLLKAVTANGAGTAQKHNVASNTPRDGSLFVWGVFDGATVTIQVSVDNSKWFDVPSGAFTIAGTVSTDFYRQFQTSAPYIRANVTNVTANTVVNAHYE